MADMNSTPGDDLQLIARVAELEALLEARTSVIVTLHRRIAELEGRDQSELAERAQHAEEEVRALKNTKLYRFAELPRRLYGRLRAILNG